jgi:hypothetical protein
MADRRQALTSWRPVAGNKISRRRDALSALRRSASRPAALSRWAATISDGEIRWLNGEAKAASEIARTFRSTLRHGMTYQDLASPHEKQNLRRILANRSNHGTLKEYSVPPITP